jgi:Bacterial protein of unknown function (DUF937)
MVAAAVPGLLAALTSLVSKPKGATKLNDAVAKQQPGVLSRPGGIGGSGQKAFIDKGSSALTLLLGGPIVSSIRAKIDTLATT